MAHPIGVRFSSVPPKEGSDLMEYMLDTIYEARVAAGKSCHRIYFLFSNSQKGGKCVSIGEGIHTGPEWIAYYIGTSYEVHHVCPEGSWILFVACNVWRFKEKSGCMHIPTISLANEEQEGFNTQYTLKPEYTHIDLQTAGRRRQGIITNIKEEEVKKEMYLQAIDVIFFNRKTKKVEYREIVVAHDIEGAYMLAAQDFGKYDPKLHVKNAHCMFGFNEQNAEDDEGES